MTIRKLPLLIILFAAFAGSAGADDSSSSSSSSTTSSSTTTVGSRPASSGQGFSMFNRIISGSSSSYSVQCSCRDGSLVLKMCPTSNYLCYCQPKSSLTCE